MTDISAFKKILAHPETPLPETGATLVKALAREATIVLRIALRYGVPADYIRLALVPYPEDYPGPMTDWLDDLAKHGPDHYVEEDGS